MSRILAGQIAVMKDNEVMMRLPQDTTAARGVMGAEGVKLWKMAKGVAKTLRVSGCVCVYVQNEFKEVVQFRVMSLTEGFMCHMSCSVMKSSHDHMIL